MDHFAPERARMKAAIWALALLAGAGCSRTGDHTDTTGPAGTPRNPVTLPSPDPSLVPVRVPPTSAAGLNSNENPNGRGTVGSGTSDGTNGTSTSPRKAPPGR